VRDLDNLGISREIGIEGRPVWEGPIPDRYYYVVKNKRISSGSWLVLFSDVEAFGYHIRQIGCTSNGQRSLIESDVPLPANGVEAKLISHSKVEQVRGVIRETLVYDSHSLLDPKGVPVRIEGREVSDKELFI
jgi:hypothetical protein